MNGFKIKTTQIITWGVPVSGKRTWNEMHYGYVPNDKRQMIIPYETEQKGRTSLEKGLSGRMARLFVAAPGCKQMLFCVCM